MHKTMPNILWMGYFLEAQRCPLRPANVHKDNLSGKQLERNGRAQSSKRTRHMKIRCFVVRGV